MGSVVVGCGKALPALVVENRDLEALVDTNDEWIVSRTGISSRHIAVAETAEDLAEGAARQALGWDEGGWHDRSIESATIDLIIYATITPDAIVPSAAGLLRERLGLDHAIAFDLNAACTGFIYGLTVAESMMAASAFAAPGGHGRNPIRRALVVGADRLSRITDWSDRSTCILFGDGAGAAVLEWDEERPGIRGSFIANADDSAGALACPAVFDSPVPFDREGVMSAKGDASSPSAPEVEKTTNSHPHQVISMDGQKVFKFAAEAMTTAIASVLDRANVALDDVTCIIPHQANERIIRYAAKKIGLPMERFQLSIATTGNTSAASVPMALADAYVSGRVRSGDKVILVGFGGGFTSGAVLLEA